MGIHYDYKSKRGERAMLKEAKRKERLALKRAKRASSSDQIEKSDKVEMHDIIYNLPKYLPKPSYFTAFGTIKYVQSRQF